MSDRNTIDQRIVVSASICVRDKVLLLRRSDSSKILQLHWEQPGGKVRKGELIVDALVREVLEETRLVVKPIRPYGAFDCIIPEYSHIIEIGVRCNLAGPANIVLSSEHDEFQWVSRDELAHLQPMHELVRTLVREGMDTRV